MTSRTSLTPDPDTLRQLRTEAGLTQRELAGLADCSLAWIASAEGGYLPKTSDVLGRVLAVLTANKDERHPGQGAAVENTGRQARTREP